MSKQKELKVLRIIVDLVRFEQPYPSYLQQKKEESLQMKGFGMVKTLISMSHITTESPWYNIYERNLAVVDLFIEKILKAELKSVTSCSILGNQYKQFITNEIRIFHRAWLIMHQLLRYQDQQKFCPMRQSTSHSKSSLYRS